MKRKDILTIVFIAIILICIIVHASVWNGVALGNLPKAYVFFSLVNLIAEGFGLKLIWDRYVK